eukprot:SAG31_NODE_4973_length_2825_cov_1.906090_2_plen_296_part_00
MSCSRDLHPAGAYEHGWSPRRTAWAIPRPVVSLRAHVLLWSGLLLLTIALRLGCHCSANVIITSSSAAIFGLLRGTGGRPCGELCCRAVLSGHRGTTSKICAGIICQERRIELAHWEIDLRRREAGILRSTVPSWTMGVASYDSAEVAALHWNAHLRAEKSALLAETSHPCRSTATRLRRDPHYNPPVDSVSAQNSALSSSSGSSSNGRSNAAGRRKWTSRVNRTDMEEIVVPVYFTARDVGPIPPGAKAGLSRYNSVSLYLALTPIDQLNQIESNSSCATTGSSIGSKPTCDLA